MNGETIKNILRKALDESTRKDLVWIENEIMAEAIYLGIASVVEFNSNQGDETYKTVIIFEGKKFVYVGERIS